MQGDIVVVCDDGAIKVYDGKAVAKGSTQRAHNEAKNAQAFSASLKRPLNLSANKYYYYYYCKA